MPATIVCPDCKGAGSTENRAGDMFICDTCGETGRVAVKPAPESPRAAQVRLYWALRSAHHSLALANAERRARRASLKRSPAGSVAEQDERQALAQLQRERPRLAREALELRAALRLARASRKEAA